MKVSEKNNFTPNEERLQVEAARQDPSCFAALYENNFDRVYAYIARRVRTREEAQDLTAEVFHQALAGLARFRSRGLPFVAWLLGIASHTLADRWQFLAKHPEVVDDGLEEVGAASEVERSAMLHQLVNTLPPDQKQVILKRFVSQKTLQEIATELGRSPGAIKQLQLRALQNLRDRLRSNHG